MLTIFSVPKPFQGQISIIQYNAIKSWARLKPSCEIILCGDDLGVREAATELGTGHIPNVSKNEYGTPLLNSVFARVHGIASQRLLCFVNTDIILLSDFVKAVQRVSFQKFLAVGQRWDVDLMEPWDFEQLDWEERLRRYVADHGELHPPAGSDYLVFPQGYSVADLPPFAVGRPGWDNWFIYRARKQGVPVVDITKVVTVVHQNHGYVHVQNRRSRGWEGPEADRNRELAGGPLYIFTLLDATHVMTSTAVLSARGWKYVRRRWQTLPILLPAARPFVRLLNLVVRCLGSLRRWVSSK